MRFETDGIHLRQSDLSTFLQCPEQMRLRHLVVDGSTFESDAATVGTVVHHAIEQDITQTGEPYTLHDLKGIAAHYFLGLLEEFKAAGNRFYSEETFGSHIAALRNIEALVTSWFKSQERAMLLRTHHDEFISEWNFDLPFCRDKYGQQIWLTGTSDIVLIDHNQVWDWKTSSSAYKKWEKQRWAVQPTVYTWAAATAGLITPDAMGRYRFDYKVFVRAATVKPPETITVYRTAGSHEWLKAQVLRVVNFVEKMGFDEEWPLNDSHVLCSPKWCPFWAQCKGAKISSPEWH